jgi:hypothetical protein
MSLNVTTSSVSSSSSAAQVSGAQSSEGAKKSSTDSSFKDEMEKVSTKAEKKDSSVSKDSEEKNVQVQSSKQPDKDKKDTNLVKVDSKKLNSIQDAENLKFATLSMNDVNNNLKNDIQLMMNTNGLGEMESFASGLFSSIHDAKFGDMFALDYTDKMFMSQSDAEFFINLVNQQNNVSAQAVAAQAQMAFDNGAELSQVQQNAKISETLLNAINIARENNQPLRIDFDQNVAVIMRFGKDGSFAANFIPGDKVVEQYLKNNLDSLKSAFEEKEIPYSDLSYSNRGSKHQKEQQRSRQQ